MQTPKWLQRKTTIDEELLLAHWELLRNPTITTYEMIDGVETRQPGNPLALMQNAFVRLGEAMLVVKTDFRQFAENVQAAIDTNKLRTMVSEYDGTWKGMGDF